MEAFYPLKVITFYACITEFLVVWFQIMTKSEEFCIINVHVHAPNRQRTTCVVYWYGANQCFISIMARGEGGVVVGL